MIKVVRYGNSKQEAELFLLGGYFLLLNILNN